jgi:methylmalonyl-CoA epimerase
MEEKRAGMIDGKINHIGVAVHDLATALRFYHETLGLCLIETKELPERGLAIAFLKAGDSLIELLAPLSADSQISSFLARRGEGIHHICLEVDDIEAELARLKTEGTRLISENAEIGAEGRPVAFLHPKSTHGVLLELIQVR